MLRRTSKSLKLVRAIKTSVIVGLFALILFSGVLAGLPASGLAQDGSVNMQVNVIERKPTDTINDFQLSPIAEATLTAQVLGAQSERQNGSSSSFNAVLYQILVYHIICWLI